MRFDEIFCLFEKRISRKFRKSNRISILLLKLSITNKINVLLWLFYLYSSSFSFALESKTILNQRRTYHNLSFKILVTIVRNLLQPFGRDFTDFSYILKKKLLWHSTQLGSTINLMLILRYTLDQFSWIHVYYEWLIVL